MKKINLVYDGDYEDADILIVPDFVFDCADDWSSRYGNWLYHQGRNDMETEGFIEWLNQYICIDGEKAQVVAMHVTVNDTEPSIDF